jgi:transcription factor STE12
MAAMVAANAANNGAQHAVHRPSDLRRSVSVVDPVHEGDESGNNSPPGLSYNNQVQQMAQHHKELLEMSRHGTPLSTIEDSPSMNPNTLQTEAFPQLSTEELPGENSTLQSPDRRHMQGAGVVRRARSASDFSPYPQKSHSCPIPTCGRLFKRLEHLKRYGYIFHYTGQASGR